MENIKLMTIDENDYSNLKYYMPSIDDLQQMADYFSVYSDLTRLKILSALSIKTMCVNDLAVVLNANQSTISHQLKALKSLGVVKDIRQGKIIYYKIASENINEILLNGVNYLMK
jgi:ArsR family transcriptional regulator